MAARKSNEEREAPAPRGPPSFSSALDGRDDRQDEFHEVPGCAFTAAGPELAEGRIDGRLAIDDRSFDAGLFAGGLEHDLRELPFFPGRDQAIGEGEVLVRLVAEEGGLAGLLLG